MPVQFPQVSIDYFDLMLQIKPPLKIKIKIKKKEEKFRLLKISEVMNPNEYHSEIEPT